MKTPRRGSPDASSGTTDEAARHCDSHLDWASSAFAVTRLGFRQTTWHDNIKKVEVSGGEVEIKTNIFPDADADAVAPAICGARISAASGVKSGVVYGQGGAILHSCR